MDLWEQVVGGRPDDPAKKGPQTRRCRSGERLSVWCLERQASWYVTHFLGQRTRPCLGDACLCKKLNAPVVTRWTGWILAAERMRPLIVRLVALTENCWDSCEELRNPAEDLKGRLLVLERPRGGARGRVYAKLEQYSRKLEYLPDLPYTQRDQLIKVWFTKGANYDEFNQYVGQEWLQPERVRQAAETPTSDAKEGAS